MAQAPLLQAVPGILSQSVMSDPKPTVAELRDNGVCRIDACLTPGVAATLLAHVNTSLADARSRVAVDGKQRDKDTFYKALKEAQPPPKVAGLWSRLERLATSARTFATHTVAPEVELWSSACANGALGPQALARPSGGGCITRGSRTVAGCV